MKYIIIFLDNNGNLAVYTGGNMHVIYCYLEMITAPTSLTSSGQRYDNVGTPYSNNNETETIQPVISALRIIQKSICEYCGRIGHKADACIIRGPKLIPPSLRRDINQFKALSGDEPTEPPR